MWLLDDSRIAASLSETTNPKVVVGCRQIARHYHKDIGIKAWLGQQGGWKSKILRRTAIYNIYIIQV